MARGRALAWRPPPEALPPSVGALSERSDAAPLFRAAPPCDSPASLSGVGRPAETVLRQHALARAGEQVVDPGPGRLRVRRSLHRPDVIQRHHVIFIRYLQRLDGLHTAAPAAV